MEAEVVPSLHHSVFVKTWLEGLWTARRETRQSIRNVSVAKSEAFPMLELFTGEFQLAWRVYRRWNAPFERCFGIYRGTIG